MKKRQEGRRFSVSTVIVVALFAILAFLIIVPLYACCWAPSRAALSSLSAA